MDISEKDVEFLRQGTRLLKKLTARFKENVAKKDMPAACRSSNLHARTSALMRRRLVKLDIID